MMPLTKLNTKRLNTKPISNLVFSTVACLLSLNLAHAGLTVGGGPIPGLPFGNSPKSLADKAFASGVKAVEKAASIEAKAEKTGNAQKREKLLVKAGKQYDKAVDKFQEAISQKHDYHEAYGALGNVLQRRHEYPAALAAYNKALTIDPQYGPALRDRGVTFLETNRIDDAKSSYLSLYKLDDPSFANELMDTMNSWVTVHRRDPGQLKPEEVEFFAAWLLTRSVIAQQAASNR